jgi:DNA repair protein RecO
MRTQAIILKKIPIREYDELVVCYTRHAGKQTYQAKSIRRHTSKQASHLDLLNLVDFTLVHPKGSIRDLAVNGHSIITQAYSLRTFNNLKSNLLAMATAFFVLETFDKLVFESQPDLQLWNMLTGQIEKLDILANQDLTHWPSIIDETRKEILQTLGYDEFTSIEDLANCHFHSLQFVKTVIG